MPLKQSIHQYYNEVAERYSYDFYEKKQSYPTLQYRHRHILELVDDESFLNQKKALDIGCGPGEMVIDLASRSFETWGIDISEEMIRIARKNIANHTNQALKDKIHLETGDIEKLKFYDKTFDLIVAAGVIEYLHNDELWIAELYRLLKPGGILILNITNKYSINQLTARIFTRLKNNNTVFKIMQYVKRELFRKGDIVRFPFIPRTHSPFQLDKYLQNHGLRKCSHRYFAFCIFPYPFDTLMSFLTTPVRKYFERFSSSNMIFWGTGYIVKAKKI